MTAFLRSYIQTLILMQKNNGTSHWSAFGLILLILVAAAPAAAQNKPDRGPDIAFTVAMPKPHTHMLEVEIRRTRSQLTTV